jgi:hypothetical protein
MTLKTIELASIEATQELVVAEGTIATYDAVQGPLTVASIVNHGTLRILSFAEDQEAAISAQSILNTGTIEAQTPTLVLKAAILNAREGSFSASQLITVESESDLRVAGGTFKSSILKIIADNKAAIHADCIEGEVHIKACELSIGVRRGDLTVTQQELLGDPVYYNGGGNLTISPTLTRGDDFSCFATGNITINGAIDLMGGDVMNHPLGRVVLVPGCVKVEYNQVPNNQGQFECTDCSLPQPLFEVIPSVPPAGTVTVNGDISVKGLSISAGDVVLNGAVTVDNANIPWDANIAGNCSMFGSNSVTVTGLVKVISRRPNGVFKGGFSVGAGQNITLANVDAGLLAETTQSGLIKVGNVDADFGSIVMLAGQDFGTGGGGGIIGGAAIQSVTALNANIQAGTLKSQSQVRLMANGTIGTGTITLDPETFSGPNSFVVPHDVRIHANINKETTTPFLAGGGSSNGTGQITVTNRSYVLPNEKSGVIAISNGPTGDVHVNGSRLKSIAGDKGTPSIVIDAGSGQVRLTGGSPLSVDGDASHDAGFIVLQGGELRAPNAAVVSASDTQGSAEAETPTVILAVDKITLPGSLTVNCNGNTGTSVKVAPKGSAGVDIVNIGYTVPIKPPGVNPVVHELAITGAGSLTLTANSENGSILCSGDPLRFANQGATHIESEGDGSKIELKFAGSPSGQDSLIFTGGAVEVVADNPQHAGGTILVTADKVKNTATSVSMHANALSDGAGGSISLDIDRGNLSLGTATGTMSLAATGMGSGAGGSISVENAKHNGTITLDPTFSTAAVNVAALGSNGDGGSIDLHADHLVNNATGGNSGLVANGVGTGKGGHIGLRLTDSITIGGVPGLFVTAISTGSGDGGDVDIVSTQGSVTIDTASLSVTAGTDGRGGKITAKTLQSSSTLTVNGSLTANGQNTKKGGDIKVLAAGLLNISTAEFHANGGPRGAGGSAELSAGGDLTVNAGQVTALAGTTGSNKGGDISVTTTSGGNLTVNADLDVNAAGNQKGGTVSLNSDGTLQTTKLISAKGGNNNGAGGVVNLHSKTDIVLHAIDISGFGTGRAGLLSIQCDEGQVTIEPGTIALAATASSEPAAIRANGGEDADGPEHALFSNTGWKINGIIDYRGRGAGKGGKLKLTTPGEIVFNGGRIWADGGEDSGDGGSITLSTGTPINLSSASDFLLSATGGQGFGLGGRVTIDKVSALDVNKVIIVNPGSDIMLSEFAGSISLNGVLCQQWMTGNPSWPLLFWSGVNPTNPSGAEFGVASGAFILPTLIRADLANHDTQIYTMVDDNAYFRFFDGATSPGADGTLGRSDPDTGRYFSVAYGQFVSGADLSAYYAGTIVHELGHVWDYIKAHPRDGAKFTSALAQDAPDHFNTLVCSDLFGAAACGAHAGEENWQILGEVIHSGNTNSEIFTRAFAWEAFRNVNPKPILIVVQNVSAAMTHVVDYMADVFAGGTP